MKHILTIKDIPCHIYNHIKQDVLTDVWTVGRTCRHRYECMGVSTLIAGYTNGKQKILDAGCSRGVAINDCVSFLKNKGHGVDVTAVDRDYDRIAQADKNGDVKFICSEIQNLTFKREFNVILCLNVIRFIKNKQKVKTLRKIASMLKNDGIVITGISKKDMREMGLIYFEPPKCALNHNFLYHWMHLCKPTCKYNDTQSLTKLHVMKYINLLESRI